MPVIDDPFTFDPTRFDTAQQNLQTAFQRAGDAVSARSRDTASARVRARTANQNRGQIDAIRRGGTGRNIGQQNQLIRAQQRAAASALATGIADVEEDFARRGLEAAVAQGNIAVGQGNLAQGITEAGIASNRQRVDEELGLREADTADRQLDIERELGIGELELGQSRLEADIEESQREELLDFFDQFARTGATVSENEAFNTRFQELINNLLGEFGIEPPDVTQPAPDTPGAPPAGGGAGGGSAAPPPPPVGGGDAGATPPGRESLTAHENQQLELNLQIFRDPNFQLPPGFTSVTDWWLARNPKFVPILQAEGII